MAVIGNRQALANTPSTNLGRTYKGGEQHAQYFPGSSNPTAFWVTRIGANLRRAAVYDGVTAFRYGFWNTLTDSPAPGALMAVTHQAEVPTTGSMTSVIADVTVPYLHPANKAFLIGPAFLLDNSKADTWDDFRRIQQSSNLGKRSYRRYNLNGPQNPFGTPFGGDDFRGDGSSTEDSGYVVWVEGEANVAPNTPSNIRINDVALSSSGALDVIDTTPTIKGWFRDANEELTDTEGDGTVIFPIGQADKMAQYQIRIKGAVSGTIFQQVGPVNATTAMQAAREFEWTVPTALASGTYRVETRVSDLAGEWSPWSSHEFSIVAATVETSGPPTGKITDTTPDNFGYTFNSNGATSSDRVQIRILKNGVTIRASGEITKTTAPGASSTITWAQTGFTAITDTGPLTYQVRARYGGVWTAWSSAAAFSINAPPNKPTSLSPSGQSFGSYPTLAATVTDSDDDSQSLAVYATVIRPNATTVQFLMTSYRGNNRWEQGTHSGIVTGFGTYQWYCEALDPSGALGPKSDTQSFTYDAIPNVVVTGVTPSSGGFVRASNPTIAWTVGGTATPTSTQQAKRWVRIFRSGTGEIVHSSGNVPTQSTTYQLGGTLLAQGTYAVEVIVTNGSGVVGSSSHFTFTVQFIPPAAIVGVNAQPTDQENGYSDTPTAVLVTWDPSVLPPADFVRYEVLRRIQGSNEWVGVGKVANQNQTSYVDPAPPGNVPLEYGVRQVESEGIDEIPSIPTTAQTTIDIRDVIITDLDTGESVAMRSIAPGDLSYTPKTDRAEFMTRAKAPAEFRGRGEWDVASIRASLHTSDTGPDPEQAYLALRNLSRIRSLGGDVYTVRRLCLREPRRRFFGSLEIANETPGRLLGNRQVSLTFTERDFVEGFEVAV